MLIALVFNCRGKRTGLGIHSEELPPDDWRKLNGNLSKQFVGGGLIHIVSKASWAHRVTFNGVVHRGNNSARCLTGEPLDVTEPTIKALLAAIDADEVERQKVPLEIAPWRRQRDGDLNVIDTRLCA